LIFKVFRGTTDFGGFISVAIASFSHLATAVDVDDRQKVFGEFLLCRFIVFIVKNGEISSCFFDDALDEVESESG
jgi:hypothetical protein